jgi:hypothetical protein
MGLCQRATLNAKDRDLRGGRQGQVRQAEKRRGLEEGGLRVLQGGSPVAQIKGSHPKAMHLRIYSDEERSLLARSHLTP